MRIVIKEKSDLGGDEKSITERFSGRYSETCDDENCLKLVWEVELLFCQWILFVRGAVV